MTGLHSSAHGAAYLDTECFGTVTPYATRTGFVWTSDPVSSQVGGHRTGRALDM
ncbi:hypothetical protein AZE42_07695 [Rhizopogon vesiculosus]|uniref:Uncharacterized protein n=1 Tax=Rhizopogon vesiculosus TaxID=180088 RepID=A0A1J8PFZ4_9AGAM|nr:hypothetical protein AZE42_07695 [Rhizopogon vesiculosus]